MNRSNGGRRRWPRVLLRAVGVMALLFLGTLGALYLVARPALGSAPGGERLEAMRASPNWSDDRFVNRLPQSLSFVGMLREGIRASEFVVPRVPVPVLQVDPSSFDAPPEDGLRVTWLGHSILLVEIDGQVVLVDPVWGPRASPFPFLGPARWYEPPIALDDLPPIDAVVLSHDHYDHLDYPTLQLLRGRETVFVSPLGVGAHLEGWGVPPDRIVELDWWDAFELGGLRIVATPARHASGRSPFDRDRTLWAGYAFLGPEHSVFYSGDTGMAPEFSDIGTRLGPFDLTMIEVGAYSQSWPDWHLGPEQALDAHAMVHGDVFLPVHWGLFNLSTHGWTEPIERIVAGAAERGIRALTLRPGGTWESGTPVETDPWWPDRPWRSAAEYPVVSRGLDEVSR